MRGTVVKRIRKAFRTLPLKQRTMRNWRAMKRAVKRARGGDVDVTLPDGGTRARSSRG